MTHVTVNAIYNPHWVYKSAIVVALCVTFSVAALLSGQLHFKHVVQTAPIPQASGGYVAVGSYGYELPPVW